MNIHVHAQMDAALAAHSANWTTAEKLKAAETFERWAAQLREHVHVITLCAVTDLATCQAVESGLLLLGQVWN